MRYMAMKNEKPSEPLRDMPFEKLVPLADALEASILAMAPDARIKDKITRPLMIVFELPDAGYADIVAAIATRCDCAVTEVQIAEPFA